MQLGIEDPVRGLGGIVALPRTQSFPLKASRNKVDRVRPCFDTILLHRATDGENDRWAETWETKPSLIELQATVARGITTDDGFGRSRIAQTSGRPKTIFKCRGV